MAGSIIYFTGVSNDVTEGAQRPDLGLLGTPAGSTVTKRVHYENWAADNGLFVATPKTKHALEAKWFKWLTRLAPEAEECLFATVPDVVGDHAKTWERSKPYVEKVRKLGFKVALVMQNGLENDRLVWKQMLAAAEVLFIGGSAECVSCAYVKPSTKAERKRKVCPSCDEKLTEWKLGPACAELVAEAKAKGKWVHMGRVNSLKRLTYADSIGCDSADGTYVGFAPRKNAPVVLGWLDAVNGPDDVDEAEAA